MQAEVNTPRWNDRILGYLRSLMNPRTIILGVTIVYFIVMAVRVERWRQQVLQAGIAMRPNYLLDVPFWLIVAAVLLLIRRWWSELVVILISGRLLYLNYL